MKSCTILVSLLLVVTSGVAAFSQAPYSSAPPNSMPSNVSSRFPTLAVLREVGFEAGIDFVLNSGTVQKRYILESNAGGLAMFDYDNDGWQDLYFVDGSTISAEQKKLFRPRNRLYHNERNGMFKDVTATAGVGSNGRWGMGVCAGDVNNDGFEDLLITNFGPNVLYLNNGNGTFRDFTSDSGLGDDGWHSACAFADYDRDGDLDVYVSKYALFDVYNLKLLGGDTPNVGSVQMMAQPSAYQQRTQQLGPHAYTAEADRFYENQGNGRFVDVTEKSGISKVAPSYGLGLVWGDYNNDGWPDVYVANDTVNNFLFKNNGNKTFTDVALLSGVAANRHGAPQASMGVDFADFDNDGDLDLIVTNYSNEYTTLYINLGNGIFEDRSTETGLEAATRSFLAWGIQFVDLNLDGLLDIIQANGHVDSVQDYGTTGGGYRQRPLLFINGVLEGALAKQVGYEGTRFLDMGFLAGDSFREMHVSRGLAVGDLNNDGHPDVVMTHHHERPSVLLNEIRGGNWLLLKLKGTKSNRSAIGARVTIRAGNLQEMREVKSGGSYTSQSDLRVHFGLGANTKVDEITIRWPNGSLQTLKDVAANQIVTVEEGVAKK